MGTTRQVIATLDFTPIGFPQFPDSPDTATRGYTKVLKETGAPVGDSPKAS